MRNGESWLVAATVLCLCATSNAQRRIAAGTQAVGGSPAGPGSVVTQSKISQSQGGFAGALEDLDQFGDGLASIGDLDGDGIGDLAVGATGADRGGLNSGALWILFMNADGTVRESRRTNDGTAGFGVGISGEGYQGALPYASALGAAITGLGDLDGDGIPDLAVGAPELDTPALACAGFITSCDRGGYFVLFMRADGIPASSVRMSAEENFGFLLFPQDELGRSLAGLGDLDGDGVPDLAAGSPGYDGAGTDAGALFIILNDEDGTPRLELCISPGVNGFDGELTPGGRFGESCAVLGDLDGDGVVDLAVGANQDTDGGPGRGAVWILFLNADGTVKDEQKISMLSGGFAGALADGDRFGSSLAVVGDVDADGVVDLAVGAALDDDGGSASGAVWILFLNPDGTVKAERKLSSTSGGLAGISGGDHFGGSVAGVGDIDGDGLNDLAVGAPQDGDGGEKRGAVWLLSLDGIVNIDFEGDGDSVPNGLQVGGATTVSSGTTIEGFPHSGLTAAIFDSDPEGPNAASSDPDLLVDTGNILMLQENPGQTEPGVYDAPDDDARGGSFVLTFGGLEVLPISIDLIDLCPAPGQSALVILVDDSGRQRVYDVPPGFTEDVDMEGGTGYRTLSLVATADQPGYRSTATASEDQGFDVRAVVLLEVQLGSSGAIDNILYDPHPDAPQRLYPKRRVRGPRRR